MQDVNPIGCLISGDDQVAVDHFGGDIAGHQIASLKRLDSASAGDVVIEASWTMRISHVDP
jgi:hypothetical protein